MDDYLSTVNQMYVQPTLEFLQPVTNFLTSGSRDTYDPDESWLNNVIAASQDPVPEPVGVPDYLKPPASVVSDVNPVYGPENNPLLTTTTSDVSAANSIFNPNSGLEGLNTYVPTNQIYSQAEKEAMMADRYANTVINAEGDKGYTGTGTQSRAGINAPDNSDSGRVSITLGGGGGSGATQAAYVPQSIELSQDLRQRTPSGSMYAPDLSAYNDSSLFNYTGPVSYSEP